MYINNYTDFINESYLLLESIVSYENDFRSFINRIINKTDNNIAKSIILIEKRDINIDHNYISLTDKDDTISFVSDRKFDSLNKYIVIDSGYSYPSFKLMFKAMGFKNTEYNTPLESGTIGKIIGVTISNNIELAHFVSDGGEEMLIDKEIGLKSSMVKSDMKVGRFVKRLLELSGYKYSDKEYEEFVNLFKSEFNVSMGIFSKFKLVSGEDIRWNYYFANNSNGNGTLGNSCMKYSECQSYLNIYVNNPDKIRLLVYQDDDGRCRGRALVWKIDDPDIIFMDRIYTNNSSDIELFKQYAKKENWTYKFDQNSNNNFSIENYPQKTNDIILYTKLNRFKYEKYPYLDTLIFMTEDGIIHNNSKKESYYLMRSTSGMEYYCNNCECEQELICGSCDGGGNNRCGLCYSGSSKCKVCNGIGRHPESETTRCTECNGSGYNECQNCNGTGKLKCHECQGSGEVMCTDCANIHR